MSDDRIVEAAPARNAVQRLRFGMAALFVVLAGQAGWLALSAPVATAAKISAPAPPPPRAALLDRNGEILATTLPAYHLVAMPAAVLDPKGTARKLANALPGLDVEATARRLSDRSKIEVQLKASLTPRQRFAVFSLALPGIDFRDAHSRVYPLGPVGAHVIGMVDSKLNGVAGLERGFDAELKSAGASGEGVRVSLDLRVQHALEVELAAAATAAAAKGGAGVVLDGRTGETLALASWPEVDANNANNAAEAVRLNRAIAVYEMGSTIKPFMYAGAIDAGIINPETPVDVSPLTVGGVTRRDPHPLPAPVTPTEALAHSSNMAPARLALALGAAGQTRMFQRLGLDQRPFADLREGDAGKIDPRVDPFTVAMRGYGHSMSISTVALAGAYSVFINHGGYVAPTLRLNPEAAPKPVFARPAADAVLAMMRAAVEDGTAKRVQVAGIAVAAKTGTAEKCPTEQTDCARNFSSIAAIFPADAPRYVVVLALDEPARTVETGGLATGGAVAAPAAGRLIGRIAPLLGVGARAAAGEETTP